MAANKTSVLVVDDDPCLTDLLVDTLDVIGYQAYPASSAEEALKILAEKKPKLVISDINMPGMSGLELLQEIRKTYRNLPVMLITGICSDTIEQRAFESGADGFLAKPFRIGTIEQQITSLLGGGNGQKVLIVDDNEDFLNSLREHLTASGCRVEIALNAKATMDLVVRKNFDLVITDLDMVDEDGLSLYGQIKKIRPNLQVIMISACATGEIIAKIKAAGIDNFLTKPLNYEKLQAIMESCQTAAC